MPQRVMGRQSEQPSPEAHSICTARLPCLKETEPVNCYSELQVSGGVYVGAHRPNRRRCSSGRNRIVRRLTLV